MNKFVTYIEETLHVVANISLFEESDRLPLYLRNGYELYTLTIRDVRCLLAKPKEQNNLTTLRKQAVQLKKMTDLNCVLCLENVRKYTKEKMLSEGIPFIIAGQQIYMPFLGLALSENSIREIQKKGQISFLTQRLLLTAIYQDLKEATLTETANILGISKMSITRCFDELQGLDIPLIKMKGKTRCFVWEKDRYALWGTVFPFLRNPVAKQYRISGQTEIKSAKMGGMSAICHYTMLTDNPYTTYAISKESVKELNLKKLTLVPDNETPDMVVQVMQYNLCYRDGLAIDPLTAILSLTKNEKEDPRVEKSIDEILEEYLHD